MRMFALYKFSYLVKRDAGFESLQVDERVALFVVLLALGTGYVRGTAKLELLCGIALLLLCHRSVMLLSSAKLQPTRRPHK
jgi:hypothetical protein